MSSLTTSNAEDARNSRAPKGLRRLGAICDVAAPQRCYGIACVAAPCIWPQGVRNAAAQTSATGC